MAIYTAPQSLIEDQISIAIISLGFIGPRHADAVIKNPNTKLVAVVDPSPGIRLSADRFKANYFSSIQDLLASLFKPTTAIICTPNHTRGHGCHGFCSCRGAHFNREATVCRHHQRIKACRFLKRTRIYLGVKTFVVHHRSYIFATAQALATGSLGRLIDVNGLWTQCRHGGYFEPEWRRTETAGPILINIVHEVDLLHHFFGPIERVQTECTISQRGFETDEGAAVTFRFLNGVVGTFFVCDNVPSPCSFKAGTGEDTLIARFFELL